ncbi:MULTISPECIES: hypothetical protein [Pedobacter]|nr:MULTISPECIES: hypothetical protein [Pedobacter]
MSLQIDLMELKARYSFIMEELDALFADAYLSKIGAKQKLADEMLREIERILSKAE